MRRRLGAIFVSLLLFAVGCARPVVKPPDAPAPVSGSGDAAGPAAIPGKEPVPAAPVEPTGGSPQPAAPVPPVAVTPRLLLDVALGDEPDQPGGMPGRVGGIGARGPMGFAAEWGEIYLADQAKGRILHYQDVRLAGSIAAPWLGEQANALRISPWGVVANEYTVALDGRLQFVQPAAPGGAAVVDPGKTPVLLGRDAVGNRYERGVDERQPRPVVRRVSPDGTVLAVADVAALDARDWCVGRDGALYAMSWEIGQNGAGRVRVYEVFPTVTNGSPPGGADSPPPPVFQGHPIPAKIRLRSPNWAPLEVASEVDRWNLWALLAAGLSTSDATIAMDATFADGSTLNLKIPDNALIEALRLSEPGLKAALDAAESVSIAIDDLPGTELELTPAQRQQLRESLAGAMAVNPYTPPQPLEQPFPQYAIHIKWSDAEGTLLLVGDRHLAIPYVMATQHSGRTAALVKGWLPVPELKPEQVGYLFLADKLEINAGADLTRWKTTVVRKLIHAQYDSQYQTGFREPITLTFWVRGEQRTVQVDTEGFTYVGKRYSGSRLTEMAALQGVP